MEDQPEKFVGSFIYSDPDMQVITYAPEKTLDP